MFLWDIYGLYFFDWIYVIEFVMECFKKFMIVNWIFIIEL